MDARESEQDFNRFGRLCLAHKLLFLFLKIIFLLISLFELLW